MYPRLRPPGQTVNGRQSRPKSCRALKHESPDTLRTVFRSIAPRRERLRYATLGAVFALVILIMTVLAGFYLRSSQVPDSRPSFSLSEPLQTNQSGLTYGPDRPSGERPDLILVVATNGRTGYVHRISFDKATGANFTSPKDAAEWARKIERSNGAGVNLPAYHSDGFTRIGTFHIDAGEIAHGSPGSAP